MPDENPLDELWSDIQSELLITIWFGFQLLKLVSFGRIGELFQVLPSVKVNSTNVEEVGPYYANGKLDVTFRGGRLYRYSKVPISEYAAILSAPSKGQYITAFIAYSYAFERLS